MKLSNHYFRACILSLSLFLLSCGGGEGESEIAKNIVFTTSKVAIVLPNGLSNEFGQTCVSSGISAPRVRLRGTIKWLGQGDLVPLVMRMLIVDDSRLAGDFAGAISPGDDGGESLAFLFDGLTTDYIPSGSTTYSTGSCALDFGGLPTPDNELKGSAQLEIPVVISITGVVRDANGEDTPFVKEISTNITYVAGSIPP